MVNLLDVVYGDPDSGINLVCPEQLSVLVLGWWENATVLPSVKYEKNIIDPTRGKF